MKKKLFNRIAGVATAAVLCVGATLSFTACTTKYPKVTITYNFNNADYAVTYTLSRYDAPKTVQHFIEVADTGFYDGTCIHDYDSSALYGGAYTLNGSELDEKDYFAEMKKAEGNGTKFTQSVWLNGRDVVENSPIYISKTEEWTPSYTVYGEFSSNGCEPKNARENTHTFGALVMYHPDMAKDGTLVKTLRNDGGKANGGNKYDTDKYYSDNSATSMFYTYLNYSNSTLDQNYSVFGVVDKNGSEVLQSLLDAISEYREGLEADDSFTESITMNAYDYLRYDPVSSVRNAGLVKTYNTPVDKPITVVSVKVNKY